MASAKKFLYNFSQNQIYQILYRKPNHNILSVIYISSRFFVVSLPPNNQKQEFTIRFQIL